METNRPENTEPAEREFTIGGLIKRARQEKGMTQEELASRVGTTKSYISKIEKNVKEVRLSTLQKIVEQGLGGELKLSIKFLPT
jgi:transcriptional regulator with XRE-family HTH domain